MEILKSLALIAALFVASTADSTAADAAGLDGTEPLICASIEVYDCGSDSDCLRGTATSIDAPQFIRLDFGQKIALATRSNGEERVTKIQYITRAESKLFLQGVQNGLGWSMTIAGETGAMALTAAGDRMAFVIFGACTPQ